MNRNKRFHINLDEGQFVDTDLACSILSEVGNDKDYDELWEKFSEWGESRWGGVNMKRTDNIKFTSGYEHVTRKMIRACFGKEFFKGDAVW